MITVASMRLDLPEFSSTADYPSSVMAYYIALAGLLLNSGPFGGTSSVVTSPPSCVYDFALEMFVAHHLVLERAAQIAAAGGGNPGEARGAVSSKSTGPISVSYDAGSSLDRLAGHWNDTEYGKRFWKFVRLFGAGPVQVGVGCGPCGPVFNGVPLNGPAYPGPWYLSLGSIN